MIIRKKFKILGRKPLAAKKLLAAAIPLIMAAQAQGIEFYAGELEATLDSQTSLGSSWRVENPDAVLLADDNGNDGNGNYAKNDAFSQIFKGSSDLQATFQNYGAFVRAKYWYDAALKNNDTLDDSNNHDLAKFSGVEIFDAFVYGEFEVMNMPIDVRLGKQAVSWGESTFILGSLDAINPFDVSAFNRPGAKIKEAVIPVSMAFANIGLTDNLSAEVFYQLENRELVLDACGTYFSQDDYVSPGCTDVITPVGNVRRDADGIRRPSSDGQFGLALRFASEALDTEFGLYAMNIHSRSPLVSTTKATLNESALLDPTTFDSAVFNGTINFGLNGTDPADSTIFNSLTPEQQGEVAFGTMAYLTVAGDDSLGATGTTFYIEYPEDIQIAGLSFATTLAGVAVSGEVSHRIDQPIQYNSDQLLDAALGADVLNALVEAEALSFGATPEQAAEAGKLEVLNSMGALAAEVLALQDGQAIQGFKLFDVSQLQVTAVQLFDQVLGATQVFLVAEAGYTYVHGFDEDGSARYDGIGVFDANGILSGFVDTVTQSAWGYRALMGAEYSNVFAGVSLSPEVFWSHDVEGVSTIQTSGFIEGNEVLGLTLNASYLNTYNGSLSYTQFSGGPNNYSADRDFVSASIGMQF